MRVGGPRDLEELLDREHPSVGPPLELACDRARAHDRERAPSSLASAIEGALAPHFPGASVRAASAASDGLPVVSLRAWRAPSYDPQALDALLGERATRGALRLVLELDDDRDAARAALQILTRAQPYLDRRNACSSEARFDRALDAHFALHDLARPLVRADYAHALDAWQWTLRLDASASLPVQLAALFHDVERLVSEPLVRIEQHAADYGAFKQEHARRGSEVAARTLAEAGFDRTTIDRVAALVRAHETGGASAEAALLNDADALSFFSLNSAGFADYYGPAHTFTKVRYTLARLSERARHELSMVRLRADVAALLAEARAEEAA